VRPDRSGDVPSPAWPVRASSDPLVGELPVEITDQGFARETQEDGSRTSLGAVTDSAWVIGRSGVNPVSSIQSSAALRRSSSSATSCPEGSGGDEETRTPDLLLAKEMLYQLSYVPLPRG
jgi:hypothetical protein